MHETELAFRTVCYTAGWKPNVGTELFLVGDIGGTNANFGIVEKAGELLLLRYSFHCKSKVVTDMNVLLRELLTLVENTIHLIPTVACWGVAGYLEQSRSRVMPTNLTITISSPELIKGTPLKTLLLINDFEAVLLGIPAVRDSIVTIQAGIPSSRTQRACLGAGTGMGVVGGRWDRAAACYLPVPSEGGHAAATLYTEQDRRLYDFMCATRGITGMVSWEQLLSGAGMLTLYDFFLHEGHHRETEITKKINTEGLQPDAITAYAAQDPLCAAVLTCYTTLYARCAQSVALLFLARDGLYIGGGIAAHNEHLFSQPAFCAEFVRAASVHHQRLLKEMPLYLITDYNVSLYGAAAALLLHQKGLI